MSEAITPTVTPHNQPDHLLTTVEVANRWNIKPNTLEGARSRGTGPKFIRLGTGKRAAIRYRFSDIVAYEDANTMTSTAQA